MNYNFLIIDKRQRVEIENDLPYADLRIMEELKNLNIPYEFAYFDELEIKFEKDQIRVFTKKTELSQFTHIIIRGHSDSTQYELKRHIVEQYKNTKILNSDFIKTLPYYSKIAQATVFSQNGIDFIPTFFSTSTETDLKTLKKYGFQLPLIAKSAQGENLLVEKEGKNVIKKDIILINEPDNFPTEPQNYIFQPFSDVGEDFRVFVRGKEIIGGWKRKAKDSFLTVSHGEYSLMTDFSENIRSIAKKTATAFHSDFMAIDYILYKGEIAVLEVNMNPGFKAYETKIVGKKANIALEIIKGTLSK